VVVIAIVDLLGVAALGVLWGACFAGAGGRIGRLLTLKQAQEDGGKNETAHRSG